MAAPDVAAHVRRRAESAGVPVSLELAESLSAYLALLARWNRKINLTGLVVDPPTDAAIDRLIVEALIAARRIRPTDRVAIDIGSGGGSPAIPMRLAAPTVAFTLVEVKARKAAFLREAVRHLGLADVTVENRAVQELASRSHLLSSVDLITIRAVRLTRELLSLMGTPLRPGGRVFYFAGPGSETAALRETTAAQLSLEFSVPLRVEVGRLLVFVKSC